MRKTPKLSALLRELSWAHNLTRPAAATKKERLCRVGETHQDSGICRWVSPTLHRPARCAHGAKKLRTKNLLILSKCKREAEREFYLRLAYVRNWSSRELERQISSALFERTVPSPAKLSPVVAELHPEAAVVSDEKVAPPVRQLPWSHDLLMMSRCKRPEERGFYLQMAQRDRRSKREPDFGVTSVNYDLPALLAQAQEPA